MSKDVPSQTKIVDCPDCGSRVGARVIASESFQPGDFDPIIVCLVKCPSCGLPICAISEVEFVPQENSNGELVGEWEESSLERVWPYPKKTFSSEVPKLVRNSLEEAERCFDARAYMACAVMCRRSLEALCKNHSVVQGSLSESMRELKERAVIDGRLLDWGEALRRAGNIGAHASDKDIKREDARDVLDFTIAICEYVYVLTDRYQRFQARQKKVAPLEKPNPTDSVTPPSVNL